MKKLLAHWWFRILVFIGLSIVLFAIQYFLHFGMFLNFIVLSVWITAISIIIYSLRAGSDYKAFGLQFDKFTLKDIGKGFIFVVLIEFLFILFGLIFGYEFKLVDNINYNSILFYTLFLFFGAYFEEVLFRGLIFQTIRERFGDIWAIVILSLLFSLVHASNPNVSTMALINIILAGIMLAVMYITTESLWLPISFHFFWNLLQQMILGSNISGLDLGVRVFELTSANTDYYWLFGGAFGIEEGVLSTIVLTFMIFISFKINTQNPYIMAVKYKMQYEESRLLDQ